MTLARETPPVVEHELLRVFAAQGFTFNTTLHEMLNEHFSHHTERRGCGFTQATRHLAVLVNRSRDLHRDAAAQLFPHLRTADALQTSSLQVLRSLPERLEREESRLFAALVADLVMPAAADLRIQELIPWSEALKMGTCPLAEKYFLEIADAFVRPKGRANVFVGDDGRPLLVEKLRLGDDHSCINVQTLVLNGVRLPPGCLIGVQRAPDIGLRPNRILPGEIIPIARCDGFRFLRLTTLSVSPRHRKRAFSVHFQAQLDAGLYAPGETTIEQLRRVAEAQL